LVLASIGFFSGITGFIVYFLVLYRNRQLKNKQEQEQLEALYRQELLKAQIEIQEQTLTHISSEIHDNITQVLFFVKLSLKMVATENETGKKKIDESNELIGQVINDLRNLSKSLSFEHITKLGLGKALEIEAERLDNSGIFTPVFSIEGESYSLGVQRELVLFRIYQEALNNALKHSGAKHFKIGLQYYKDLFTLTVEDDGNGFLLDLTDPTGGLGLNNIRNRAALIGAAAYIESSPGHGCSIRITLNPFEHNIDGHYSDRIS
jgi:signal transduction histidine kinase